MKQFIIIAYDATDEGAYERRLASRQAHTDNITRLRASGNVLCGIAILDDNQKMTGSVVITNFESRAALDECLKSEPYIVNKVWGEITILNGQLGLSFSDLIKKN